MKRMTLPKPKNCPFCGNPPKVEKAGLWEWAFISCQSICAVRPAVIAKTTLEALTIWNRRKR